MWLSRSKLAISIRIIHEDESSETAGIDSMSMRGAQREITGWLVRRGYTPVGRWRRTRAIAASDAEEALRKFRV